MLAWLGVAILHGYLGAVYPSPIGAHASFRRDFGANWAANSTIEYERIARISSGHCRSMFDRSSCFVSRHSPWPFQLLGRSNVRTLAFEGDGRASMIACFENRCSHLSWRNTSLGARGIVWLVLCVWPRCAAPVAWYDGWFCALWPEPCCTERAVQLYGLPNRYGGVRAMGAEQSRAAHPSRGIKHVLVVWHASSRFEQNSPGNPSNTLRTLVACSGGDLSHSALAPTAHVSNLCVVGPPAGPLAFGLGGLAFPSSGFVCVLLRLRVCASSFAHLACSGSLGLFLHRFANLGVLIVRPVVVSHSLCALSSSSGHHAPVPSRRPAPAANPSSPGWGGAANRMRPQVGMDESAGGFGMGVLPYQARSCNALLALLVRWGFFTERLGGLRGADEKAACSELLTALLRELYGEGDLKVTLALDDDWVNVWPRPDCSRNVATLRICSDGILGLGGLEEVCENMTACRWRQHLVSVAGADLRIGNVLARAGVHKPLSSLFRQLVWQLGHKLQSSIMVALAAGSRSAIVSMSAMKVSSVVGEASQLDKLLVRYVASLRSASEPHRQISIATDKSVVGSLAMQATAIAFLGNICGVAPPQALWGSVGPLLVRSGGGLQRCIVHPGCLDNLSR